MTAEIIGVCTLICV